ncbi:MAG: aminoacyl-tRNA hydrolase [bacterium]|nr:aminoacyl-tRNA hydrolase [bacterium]
MSEFNLDDIKIIVGLGNPGTEYEQTRHNAGAMMLTYLQNQWNFPEFKHDKYSNAMLSKGTGDRGQGTGRERVANASATSTLYPVPCTLVFPHTFMNESGQSVAYLMEKEHLQPEQLLVLHDDKDFNFEELKLQKEISSAGHKGVQSIIDCLGTSNFWRLRIGIGPVPEPMTTDIFVLQKFNTDETKKLDSIFQRAVELI